jgi:hypothetical protein
MGYLTKLNAESHKANRSAIATPEYKPLTDQITELMASLPPALQDRPWNMSDLVQRLAGKYRARPHTQQVGEALRRLGWIRKRVYGDYGGVRLWVRQ